MLLVRTLAVDDEDLKQRFGLVVPKGDPFSSDLGWDQQSTITVGAQEGSFIEN